MTPTAVRPAASAISVAASDRPDTRAIPFDHAFRYVLTGTPGNVLNSVVTISIEASFTAVSIGYGVIPNVQPIIFGARAGSEPDLGSITMGEIIRSLNTDVIATNGNLNNDTGPEAVFKNGIKLNPAVAELALQNDGRVPLSSDVLARLFQVVGSPTELIQFKYAIFDEGSGREFQSEPILNIAGLGSAGGERPFRYFAQPIVFSPRSSIRMEITEISDVEGELHVVLQGFKMLGGSSPSSSTQRRTLRRR
jgi:hypothetical protein